MVSEHEPAAQVGARRRMAAMTMPVLGSIAADWNKDIPLAGERIALCGHITEATAVQVETLKALGADIAWCASSTATTDEGIRAAIEREGIFVTGRRGMSEDELYEGVLAVRDHWGDGPTLVLDEGARLIHAFHASDCVTPAPRAAAEKTPEGIERLRRMELAFPVLESDESLGKRLVDNPHGTAQSLLETFLAVSGRLLTGKVFALIGYGRVGEGIAEKARGLGARVIVVDIRHTRALIAALNGFEIASVADALACADVVCTVTGRDRVVRETDFHRLKDGAILFNGGHSPQEIDMIALNEATRRQDLSPGLAGHCFPDERTVFVIADGQIANLAAGRGNPNEAMDVTFACQVLALLHVSRKSLEPGLHPLPRESEHAVAQRYAAALGLDITALS